MSFLDYLGLVSLREHNRAMELVRRQRDDETMRANVLAEAASRSRSLKTENAALRDERDALAAELAALRPDAQKWRDRKQADRDYRANKRKVVA